MWMRRVLSQIVIGGALAAWILVGVITATVAAPGASGWNHEGALPLKTVPHPAIPTSLWAENNAVQPDATSDVAAPPTTNVPTKKIAPPLPSPTMAPASLVEDTKEASGDDASDSTGGDLPKAGKQARSRYGEAIYFYLVGQMLLHEHHWQTAEKAFARVVRTDPAAIEAWLNVAQLATQRGDLNKAQRYARQVVKREPGHQQARLLLAGIASATRAYAEAADHYAALLKANPDHMQSRLLLAQLYGRLNKMDQAKKVLEPLFKESYRAWRAHLAMGRAYISRDQLKEAVPYIEKARALAPHQMEPVLALGSILQELERSADAEAVYRAYLDKYPDNRAIHSRLGRLLLLADDREAALSEFRALTRLAPDSVQPRLTAALILISQEKFEEALKELRLAEALQPTNTAVDFYLGQVLEALDHATEAMRYYGKISQGRPFHMRAQLRLALLEAEQSSDNLTTARARIEKLHKEYPDRPELLLALSFLLLQEENYTQVVQIATQGLALASDQTRFIYNRAMAYDKLGNWPEAEKDLRAYIKENPDDAHALNYLGYTWADHNVNLEEAHTLLSKAMALAPNDGFISDSLGWVLYRLNRLDAALTVMQQAVRLEPEDATINEHLGDVLLALGRTKEAQSAWRRALELNPDNKNLREKIEKHVTPIIPASDTQSAPTGSSVPNAKPIPKGSSVPNAKPTPQP
jgi:tetratricopeptide (TPR) repeat protein